MAGHWWRRAEQGEVMSEVKETKPKLVLGDIYGVGS